MQSQLSRLIKILGLLFLTFFLARYFRNVDLSLTYYIQCFIPYSLTHYLKEPGGFLVFLAGTIGQLFKHPNMAVLTAIILIILYFLSLLIILKNYLKNKYFIPVLLLSLLPLIVCLSEYKFPFEITFSMVLTVGLGAVYSILPKRSYYSMPTLSVLLIILAYYLAGGPGLFLFITLLLIEGVKSNKYKLFWLQLLFGITIPLLGIVLMGFNQTIEQAYKGVFLVSSRRELPEIAYLILFAPLLAFIVLYFSKRRAEGKRSESKKAWLLYAIQYICLIGIFAFILPYTIDDRTEKELQVEKCSFQNDWDQVLTLADVTLCKNRTTQFHVNRALYQKGLFLSNFFHYPQYFGGDALFLEKTINGMIALQASNLYLDLGYANEARHWANEANVVLGDHPETLKNLVYTYLALDRKRVAKKYFDRIASFHAEKEWTAANKHLFSEEFDVLKDSTIARLVRFNPDDDFFARASNPGEKNKFFYWNNLSNKMAFEYNLADHLLKHDVGSVLKYIQDFKRFNYPALPRVMQEALMVYYSKAKDKDLDLHGYTIDQQIIKEFQEFFQVLSKSGSDKSKAKKNLTKYANTYWYYLIFNSPHLKS